MKKDLLCSILNIVGALRKSIFNFPNSFYNYWEITYKKNGQIFTTLLTIRLILLFNIFLFSKRKLVPNFKSCMFFQRFYFIGV